MTAINTPLDQRTDSQAYRRGLLAGAAASMLLAGAMAAGALAAGVVQLPQAQAPAVPAAPGVETWTDYGERHLLPVNPSIGTWSDYGERLSAPAPAEVAPVPAEVAPPAIAPPQNVRWDEYNQYNLLYKGTRGMF